jgi:glycosyltransferase involved in cell wall biosynthesis
MKHLVQALPFLSRAGWSNTVIAGEIEPGTDVEFIPCKTRFAFRHFDWLLRSSLITKTVEEFRRLHPNAIVLGTPSMPFGADLSTIQFLQNVWLKKERRIPERSWRDRVAVGVARVNMCMANADFRSEKTKIWLAASECIASELEKLVVNPNRIRVLPNSYDESRFGEKTAEQHRARRRAELGFDQGDFVFSFLSQGHHRRKGFWLAVEALDRLRRTKLPLPYEPYFLVIGGNTRTLARLVKTLSTRFRDWHDWIRFTGMVDQPETFLAAGDAFLFPSYFEAFCLAEIEAAALHLPLLLTSHCGSEMILQDGYNGIGLSFDPEALSIQLGEFLRGATSLGPINPATLRPVNFHPSVGKALTPQGYSNRLIAILEELRSTRTVRA